MPNQQFQDQEILTDMLGSQKMATSHFNLMANECTSQKLKRDMLDILQEEQSMQSAVFVEMNKRGWYNPAPAQQQMIDQTRTKFEGVSQQLS
jgi:spore coat protein CotF